MSKTSRVALVIGATGGIGGETAFALARKGWQIRAFSRTTRPSLDSSGWEWIKGDALDRHFRGVWDKDGTEMIAAIRRVTGKLCLPVRALPWSLLKLASPFNETMRELYATRPLWTTPIELDNTRLVRFLGKEPHTDLDVAMERTLRALGCLSS